MRRPERMAEVLREEISEIVGYELDDPRLRSVTVTDVKVAPDLRDANIYVLVEGDEDEKELAMSALSRASTFVRRQVALNLDLRHAPLLHFARDTVEENAARVDEILEEISEEETTEQTEET